MAVKSWPSLLVVFALGCGSFDERWTVIEVIADPSLVGPATQLGYCFWGGDSAVEGGDGRSLLYVREPCDPVDPDTVPIPGSITVRNALGRDGIVSPVAFVAQPA